MNAMFQAARAVTNNASGIVDIMLTGPAVAAAVGCLPKVSDPQAGFPVQLLANVGFRVLSLVQAVLSAIALPFVALHTLVSLYCSGFASSGKAFVRMMTHANAIPAGIISALGPQGYLNVSSDAVRAVTSGNVNGIGESLRNALPEELRGMLQAQLAQG